jgi:hypothetical protein
MSAMFAFIAAIKHFAFNVYLFNGKYPMLSDYDKSFFKSCSFKRFVLRNYLN